MAPRNIPEFDEIELVSTQRNSATYVSFGAFHFQDFWRECQSCGATTCNIVPNTVSKMYEI